ncbi:MAG: helix-turn-helix transcriptional regulator [Clostridia bacterium]|nr:helix-turn-helix transcriptional regulator [Clostridia bacterium]
MISFEPFYKTMKKKDLTTYKLIKDYNISRSLLDRLKHNKPLSTVTIDDLCKILSCRVEDIMVFHEDDF